MTNPERLTSIGAMVEYTDTVNNYRLTDIGAMVEYTDTVNNYRLTSIGVMVEYSAIVLPTGRVYGPALQCM